MSKTTQSQHCGKCGGALSVYAPDGLCAACLLESAFEEGDAAFNEPAGRSPLLVFNDYELLEEIARGGMGVVYRARQISLHRPVAVKMMLGGHLANAAELKRFHVEAETAAQLQHPNIVAIHEVGEHAGQPFFSMDLVEGQNLAQLVRDEPLPSRRAAGYLKTIAEAVHYAHSRGVLHRDLKPSNILIDAADQPRITDFGLAKRLTDSQPSTNDPQLTQTGQALGSPSFIPPEQAAGQKAAIGPASDVYSLGAVLYHLLAARPPFVAETIASTLRMVAEQEPVSPRLLNASVPRDLETICLKCLEKDPRRRYTSAQALAEELGRFLRNEPIQARPAGVLLKVHRWCLRNKALAVAGTASLALLLVVAIGSPVAAFRIKASAKQATSESVKSRQVAQFLKDMLQGVGPSRALGSDTRMLRDILDKTVERLGHDLTNHPVVEAELRYTIGQVYVELGEYRRAEAMHRQALAGRRQVFGNEHLEVANSLSGLASALEQQNRNGEAEGLVREALRIRTKLLGDEHVEVAWSLHSLAIQLTAQGQRVEAEAFCLQALTMRRKLLGHDARDVAFTLNTLGNLKMKDHAPEAEQAFREAVSILKKIHGDAHPDLEVPLDNLAMALQLQGKCEAAAQTAREAVAMKRKILGPNHPHLGRSLGILGWILRGEKKYAEAEPLNREEFEIKKSTFGYEHPETRMALDALLDVFRGQGKFKEANSFLRDEVAQLRQSSEVSTPGASNLLQVMNDARIALLVERDKLKEDREVSLELAALAPENSGAWSNLTEILARTGRWQDVVTVYSRFSTANPTNANGWLRLGGVLGRIGHWEQAAGAMARAVEVEPLNPNPYHLLAPLLVATGDREGYRQHCARIQARFAETREPVVAERMAKACLILPGVDVDFLKINQWLKVALTAKTNSGLFRYSQLGSGLAGYRQADHASALETMRQVLARSGGDPNPRVAAWAVVAMASHGLNQAEEARSALAKARELADAKLPKREAADLGSVWNDWIITQALLREAGALIEGTPPEMDALTKPRNAGRDSL